MKQNRIDNPPFNMGIKGRMRRMAVIAGRRLARQAMNAFTAWRLARRVAKADPEVARLARLAADRAAKHRKAEPTRRELRARVIANLAREQGVTLSERQFS